MARRDTRGVRQEDRDGEITQRRYGKRHWIADDGGTWTNRHRWTSAEQHLTVSRGNDRRATVAQRETGCADHERPVAIFVREAHANLRATDRRTHDLPQRAIDVCRHTVDRIRQRPSRLLVARRPCGEPRARLLRERGVRPADGRDDQRGGYASKRWHVHRQTERIAAAIMNDTRLKPESMAHSALGLREKSAVP